MEQTKTKSKITVEATINAPVSKVWELWTEPRHIMKWNSASPDWHTPSATNDLRVNGQFTCRMEAKDGSFGFDFAGTYDEVVKHKKIAYTMEDDRKVEVHFESKGDATQVTETFEAESTNSLEMQKQGWQAILDNFKHYAEKQNRMKALHFEITIDKSPKEVYETMLDEKHYSEWTAEFSPTSRYEGSWKKGSKILFLGTNDKGETEGMVSRIAENTPAQFVSIEHLGMVSNGKEITSGESVEGWAGALENYTFKPSNNGTLLLVDMDSHPDYVSYFSETWPKALKKLKNICEGK